MEDEIELRSCGVVVLELHLATGVPVRARASGYREHGISRVGEWALDRDLAGWQESGPVALPGLTRDCAHAIPLVGTDRVCIGRVVDVIREREDVPDGVSRLSIGDGIGGRMFDHRDRVTAAVMTVAVASARIHRDREHGGGPQ